MRSSRAYRGAGMVRTARPSRVGTRDARAPRRRPVVVIGGRGAVRGAPACALISRSLTTRARQARRPATKPAGRGEGGGRRHDAHLPGGWGATAPVGGPDRRRDGDLGGGARRRHSACPSCRWCRSAGQSQARLPFTGRARLSGHHGEGHPRAGPRQRTVRRRSVRTRRHRRASGAPGRRARRVRHVR